jgi:hypothetical protein
MAILHNDVIDAALEYISANGVEAEIQDASNAALVNAVVLDAGNYGAAGDNSGAGGGRKIQALASSSSDMKNISVDSAGSATHVAIKDVSGNVLVTASITSAPVALGASDQVNLSTFSVIIKDPA